MTHVESKRHRMGLHKIFLRDVDNCLKIPLQHQRLCLGRVNGNMSMCVRVRVCACVPDHVTFVFSRRNSKLECMQRNLEGKEYYRCCQLWCGSVNATCADLGVVTRIERLSVMSAAEK